MISLLRLKKLIREVLNEKLSIREFNERLEHIKPNSQIINFLAEKYRDLGSQSIDLQQFRVLNRCAYQFESKNLGIELARFLQNFKDFEDDQLWDFLSEIEFSFTLLGRVGDAKVIYILEYFSMRKLYWDDTYNFNLSAIRAIANIDCPQSIEVLNRIANSSDNELKFESQRLLKKLN